MKKCFKCSLEKTLDEFYKHKQMPDGHLNKCKSCTKNDVKYRENILRQNIEYVKKERERAREKYYRLNYIEKKVSKECKCNSIKNYKNKYPEKYIAKYLSQRVRKENMKNHLHHWSYNKEHALDVIELSIKEHNFLHRHMIYDAERFMYRRCDNNQLLDTKESHLEYFNYLLKTQPF